MWRRQLSGSESFQGLEDMGTHRCVKFASWSILPTCEGGTSSGSLLVWNWVIERECSLGAVRKQFRTLSLKAFHGHSTLGPSGDHYQITDPAPWLGRVELSPTSPDLGRLAHLAGEGPARTGSSPPGAWFVCSCTWQPRPTMVKGLGNRSTFRAPGPPASETRGCSLPCELHYPTGTVASSTALWCGEEVCPPAFSFSVELQGRQEPRLSAASLCLSSAGQVF